MLIISIEGRNIHIPSEFCLINGVPDSFKNCRKSMGDLNQDLKKNPDEIM